MPIKNNLVIESFQITVIKNGMKKYKKMIILMDWYPTLNSSKPTVVQNRSSICSGQECRDTYLTEKGEANNFLILCNFV